MQCPSEVADIGIPISLLVGGGWLSGQTTTERVFLEQTISFLAEAYHNMAKRPDGSNPGDVVKAEIETEATIRTRLFKHLIEAAEANVNRGRFIYLANVSMISAGALSKLAHPIVRISIDHVEAVQFGVMQRS